MNKVLIFGGSFSPPTLAHEAIIKACLALGKFDELWLMPSRDRDDKEMSASDVHRLEMVNIMKNTTFAGDGRVRVSNLELNLPAPTKLYKTVQALSKTYPQTEFWFAFGVDAYEDMPKWERGRELKQSLNIIVLGDNPPEGTANLKTLFVKLNPQYSNRSSTQARKALASGGSTKGVMNQAVAVYVIKHKLYS